MGVPLQRPFRAVVQASEGDALDLSQVVDELEMIRGWSQGTLTATAVVEKIHKTNKDLATARGQSKARDIVKVQLAAEMGHQLKAWEDARNSGQHAMDPTAVQYRLHLSNARANRRQRSHPGNPK